MDRIPRLVHEQRWQVGERGVQGEGERALVDHAHPDLGEISEFTGVELGCPAQAVEQRGVFGAEAGREDALVGVGEIAGGDRLGV